VGTAGDGLGTLALAAGVALVFALVVVAAVDGAA
jgi:hypothetical protein